MIQNEFNYITHNIAGCISLHLLQSKCSRGTFSKALELWVYVYRSVSGLHRFAVFRHYDRAWSMDEHPLTKPCHNARRLQVNSNFQGSPQILDWGLGSELDSLIVVLNAIHSCPALALCLGLLSCWKINNLPQFSFRLQHFPLICLYCAALLLTSADIPRPAVSPRRDAATTRPHSGGRCVSVCVQHLEKTGFSMCGGQ